jgi:hypothetical protein
MGIYKGKINPLNLLSARRLNRIPPNFKKIYINEFIDIKTLDRWIYLNLDGRYCVRRTTIVKDNTTLPAVEIGLENHSELSMLTLACPHLQGSKLILSK